MLKKYFNKVIQKIKNRELKDYYDPYAGIAMIAQKKE